MAIQERKNQLFVSENSTEKFNKKATYPKLKKRMPNYKHNFEKLLFSKWAPHISQIFQSYRHITQSFKIQCKTLGILTGLPKYKVFFPAEVGVKLIATD